MKQAIKRFAALIVTVVIMLGNMIVVHAETFSTVSSLRDSVTIYLNQLNISYGNAPKTTTNLNSLLIIYSKYLACLDFISNNVVLTASPNNYNYIVSDTEWNGYIFRLQVMQSEINRVIESDTSSSKISFRLRDLDANDNISFPTSKNSDTTFFKELENIKNGYIDVKMTQIVQEALKSTDSVETLASTEENRNAVILASGGKLGAIAKLQNTIVSEVETFNNTNVSRNLINKNETNTQTLVFTNEGISTLMKAALDKYTLTEISADEIDIRDSNDVLSYLTNTTFSNGELSITDGQDNAELTELGALIISAGVLYNPFSSKAGNQTYMDTVKSFIKSEEQWTKVSSALKKAISIKKPLYVANASDIKYDETKTSTTITEYRYAFVNDLVQYNSNTTVGKDNRGFALIKGSMSTNPIDSSTFDYTQGVQEQSTLVSTGSSSSTTDTNVTDTTTNNSAISAAKITTGSDSVIGTSEEMTLPVSFVKNSKYFLSGTNISELYGNTTYVVLKNALADVKYDSKLTDTAKGMLFLNGLGDIVLYDDTIILPAIANPTFYSYSELDDKLDLNSNGTINQEVLTKGYYPYTSSFMGHLPDIIDNETSRKGKSGTAVLYRQGKVRLKNANDKGKYIIGFISNANVADEFKTDDDSGANVTQVAVHSDSSEDRNLNILPLASNALSVTDNTDESTSLVVFRHYDNNLISTITSLGSEHYYAGLDQKSTTQKVNIFPVSEENNETDMKLYAALVTSARRYVSNENGINNDTNLEGNFRTDYFIRNAMSEALRGTQYSSSIVKNAEMTYDEIVADTGNRFVKFLKLILEKMTDTLGSVDGVLGMRNAYENMVFLKILKVMERYYIFIVLALLLLIAARYLHQKLSIVYTFFILGVIAVGFLTYTTIFPTLIPSIYNFVISDMVEDIGWSAIIQQVENYKETYADNERKNTNGDPKPYTSTITLYQLSNSDIEDASGRLGITTKDIKSGEIIYLDSKAGIFLQGNMIKMSIDKLFSNNTIQGMYETQWTQLDNGEEVTAITGSDNIVDNPYTLRITTQDNSLDTYYMPFNKIARVFVNKLNTLSSQFYIQRKAFAYDDDFFKDAFLVNAYVNSGLFLAPGDSEALAESLSNYADLDSETLDAVKGIMENYFVNPEDWLGLTNAFLELTEEDKDTLWAATLREQGYYTMAWEPTEKLDALIQYVNMQTKMFVIKNEDQLTFVSDENAIKIISMFATTAFNHYASEVGKWLYPNYINNAELELKDVLKATLTTVYNQGLTTDGSLVDSVDTMYGLLGVFILIVIMLCSSLFILIMTYIVPILYALAGIFIIYCLIIANKSSRIIKGYAKVTLLTVILYFIFNASIALVYKLGQNWFSMLLLSISSIVCCSLIFFMLTSLRNNIIDFTSVSINGVINDIASKITRGSFNNVTGDITYRENRNILEISPEDRNPEFDNFRRYSSIDSIPVSQAHRKVFRR